MLDIVHCMITPESSLSL